METKHPEEKETWLNEKSKDELAPRAVVDGVVNGVVDDVVDGMVDGMVDGVVDGVSDAVVDGVSDAVVDGLVDCVVDAVVDCVVDSVVDGVVDGMVDAVVDGLVDGVVDGVVNAVIDAVIDAVVDDVVDGVVDDVVDGMVDTVVDDVVDDVVDGVVDDVVDGMVDDVVDDVVVGVNDAVVCFSRGGHCSSRTLLEKILVVLLVAALVAFVITVISLLIEKHNKSTPVGQGICVTRECVQTAARVASFIDFDVDPCDNFYQFACGDWMKDHVIPEDKSYLNMFGILEDRVDIIVKRLLEEEVPEDIPSIKKAKDLFYSCMDMKQINALGDKPLKELLIKSFGGWPLTHADWKESDFDLESTMVKLNMNGLFVILLFGSSYNYKNSSKYSLNIDQPVMYGLPGVKYYLVERNDTNLASYEDYIYGVGNLMGFADPRTARKDIEALVDFEILLANISVLGEMRRDMNSLYNPMTLEEIDGNYSSAFNWTRYASIIFSHSEIGIKDVTSRETIINRSPPYFQRLTEVLRTTPKRTLANFLLWRLIHEYTKHMGEKYLALRMAHEKAILGVAAPEPRYSTCIKLVTDKLSLPVGRLFVQDNFDMEAENVALDMIKELKVSFDELLEFVDWMDEGTKRVATEKNAYIGYKIGYPKELYNDTYIEEMYMNLTYDKNKLFENLLTNTKEDFFNLFRNLRKEVDKEKWAKSPTIINAHYNAALNQIMFPAAIFQPPFFSKTFPKSMNFGGIGVVIGHEITHGFDDKGRQLDKNGNLAEWWTQSAIEKFKNKARCIVEQYGNFTLTQINTKLNGILTQGENIADNGGLKQAFRAYRNWVQMRGKEEDLLPGLNFTHNQLFFINFAQLWCTLRTKEYALASIRTGSHSPGEFRVIGSAQNSREFSEAFKCPLNSNMNPETKCAVW
ncbi:neprilysin-like [Physella acuta]|uniref:neprilysin-like n=1 Tax=Physella acuta TaxID=109671 RepID=UPI0027DE7504|nr:neprilysin-like [Physella acuta]